MHSARILEPGYIGPDHMMGTGWVGLRLPGPPPPSPPPFRPSRPAEDAPPSLLRTPPPPWYSLHPHPLYTSPSPGLSTIPPLVRRYVCLPTDFYLAKMFPYIFLNPMLTNRKKRSSYEISETNICISLDLVTSRPLE